MKCTLYTINKDPKKKGPETAPPVGADTLRARVEVSGLREAPP